MPVSYGARTFRVEDLFERDPPSKFADLEVGQVFYLDGAVAVKIFPVTESFLSARRTWNCVLAECRTKYLIGVRLLM